MKKINWFKNFKPKKNLNHNICYTRTSHNILILMFCTSLGQCKVNVGCICVTKVRRKLFFFNFHPTKKKTGNSEREGGGGVNDYGIPRALGGGGVMHFGNSEGKGG